jgi:flagellar hook-basal body complex protein FliE
MSQTDVNALLSRMRTLAAQADNRPAPAKPAAKTGESDFGKLMREAVGKVDGMQQKADNMSTAFERGDSNVDLGQVMVAVQKEDVSFKAMSEVRNKLVSAYQEIMNMPVYRPESELR